MILHLVALIGKVSRHCAVVGGQGCGAFSHFLIVTFYERFTCEPYEFCICPRLSHTRALCIFNHSDALIAPKFKLMNPDLVRKIFLALMSNLKRPLYAEEL